MSAGKSVFAVSQSGWKNTNWDKKKSTTEKISQCISSFITELVPDVLGSLRKGTVNKGRTFKVCFKLHWPSIQIRYTFYWLFSTWMCEIQIMCSNLTNEALLCSRNNPILLVFIIICFAIPKHCNCWWRSSAQANKYSGNQKFICYSQISVSLILVKIPTLVSAFLGGSLHFKKSKYVIHFLPKALI